MCACRCGIKVHLQNGSIRYIEGNRDHPVNRGVLCAKGSAGIMQHYAPARLTKPLKRVGERGTASFEEIEWDEALETAAAWLGRIREDDPRKLAFFTGRDQSQALTGWWASQFGTPNYAAHGGFCSVNMAAGGLYTIGGSFWEFGEPDWERCRYFMMFGCAEDHDSNPLKLGISRLKGRGVKFVSVNPVRTGYSAVADEWLGIRPGTDGLLILSIVHELLKAGKVDVDYLIRYTNAAWLVLLDEGAGNGLFVRTGDDKPIVWDRETGQPRPFDDLEAKPALKGVVTLASGRKAVPVFHLLAERYLDADYDPERVAEETGIPATTIRRLAAELATVAFEQEVVIEQPWTDAYGRRHQRMVGRPVGIHAMRGISAHSNGFHTCRALHLLQVLLGSIDCPGGFRYKAPFPKPIPPGPKPAGKPDHVEAGKPMPGPPLGFPTEPDDLLVDDAGRACRIDKAFSWEAPLAAHGMMHLVITNAYNGDPYPIDTLFMYMANMAWNSAMNVGDTIAMLTAKDEASGEYRIPHIIYSDAYFSEMVAYADLILPDTTYLERWDCISVLDRPISSAEGPADSIRQPVVAPDRDVRPFQDVLLDLGTRLGLPGMTKEDGEPRYPGGYADYLVHHERKPGVGSLMGWRGQSGDKQGVGPPNPDQLKRYIENGCFWQDEIPEEGAFFKHANQAYLDYAKAMGFIDQAAPIVIQLYSEVLQKFRLAADGHGIVQPPDQHRERVGTFFDPLPFWYPPFEDLTNDDTDFPMHAITQRPMAMYHSWGSMNAWLRQIHGSNRLYMSRKRAQSLKIGDDDWVWITSRHGKVKAQVRLMDGVNDDTVWTWNAIGKRRGAWSLAEDAPEAEKGFLLNHLIDELLPEQASGYRYATADPVTGQAAWFDLRVRVERADPKEAAVSSPQFAPLKPPQGRDEVVDILRYGAVKVEP
ncbi:MAG: molybdopterin oxidoreductase family protein [Alphaproteobacteria bacterium]